MPSFAAMPLLVVAHTGQAEGKGMVGACGLAAIGTLVFRAARLVAGLLVITGADHFVEATVTSRMPAWLVDLTTTRFLNRKGRVADVRELPLMPAAAAAS